jgi:hypothetical protein
LLQPERCGVMFTCIKNRLVAYCLIPLLVITTVGCLKNKANDGTSVAANLRSSSNEIARKWIVGLWKENGSGPLKGPVNTYSWGESKFDEAAMSIDLNPTLSIISTIGIERIVDAYELDGGVFTFSLRDGSGHVRETLSVKIENDGTISFPEKTQKTTLSVNLDKLYHKVDGPYRDWSVVK